MTDVTEIAKQLGKRGGDATKKNHGKEYYRDLAQKGLAIRWQKVTCQVCGYEDYTAKVTEHRRQAHQAA